MKQVRHIPIYKVQLVREGTLIVPEKQVKSPQDVADVLREYLKGADREHFVALHLNAKLVIVGIETVSVGILDASFAHPREVFKAAILNNAASIIVGHNHPSGYPTYSSDDVGVTKRLVEAGEIIGIPVEDHVIIGEGNRYCSLREEGII
jgi:DNA repair protein RadC